MDGMKPVLLINLKTYGKGTGGGALKLARTARRFSSGRADIIVAAQPTDIAGVSGIIKTFSQHIDPIGFGAHTGRILPEAVRKAGAKGTLINHSERRIPLGDIGRCVSRARETGLITVCCASSPGMVRKIAGLRPDFIAIEPPELIGTKTPVSQAKPGFVAKSVEIVRKISGKTKILCGAGIHSKEDVAKAMELGASGVLVASAVVKSGEPGKVIRELIGGFG
jgi:triosephosphate isomerase